ncbi:SUKH-4 family immunity protein [Streptomyces sp. NPDC097619]|uniref:SUKH-4 family immunity protein n=1 Tax=Streptomyces sp. NPDC097619 TaxID=3157228 RepID=UPI0033335B6B
MVTFAQAQERAEEWVNGDVPAYQHREVRVREFGLGFVVWAEDRPNGPVSGGGRQRLVIARDSGEATLWPGLPVGEVIRRFEEAYGAAPVVEAESSVPPQRIDSEQTSFMLSPPEWLQEAADRAGIPGGPGPGAGSGGASGLDSAFTSPAAPDASAASEADTPAAGFPVRSASGSGAGDAGEVTVPFGAPVADDTADFPDPGRAGGAAGPVDGAAPVPSGHTPWAGTDVNTGSAEEESVPLPATVFAPPLSGSDVDEARAGSGVAPEAKTTLMQGGSGLPRTVVGGPAVDGALPPAPGPDPARDSGGGSAPGSASGAERPVGAAPGAPGSGGGDVHHAATMLAGPSVLGAPGGPGQPPAPPGPPGAPQGAAVPPPGPAGAPQGAPGVPTVGPGYQAVLRYRAPDGSEQQLIRRSAPGTPHPEWQILHELRAMNVPPQQVLELHTELASCELPGGYCARMIRETWPQVRITSVAPYGSDHAGRQQGMRHLLTHQGELHQVADGPARPAPVRAPLPQVPLQPAVPMEVIGQELAGAFGPQGVFRFDQRAVSRQGVPDLVAHTLVVAGLPVDFGPFFWAQAVPGQPVPTLAELAAQRGVRAAPDAGSYLVVGSDFGKALCVQYGTAHIVAVPVEAGPDGGSVAPQFVSTSLPQFARSLAMLGHMWRLRLHLTPEQAGRWTVDFQANLAGLDPAALAGPENWWSVLVEQMWDGLL